MDVPLRAKLGRAPEAAFEALVGRAELAHMRFYLTEERRRAEVLMDPVLEDLQQELTRDGYHAWGRAYDLVSGALQVEVDRGRGPERLSVEQAKHLLESRDGALREQVAGALAKAWGQQKELFAAALNHLNGFRQVVYRRRGVDELELPLRENRMSRASLDAMFGVIEDFRPRMARFLAAKARLLGLERLRWFDLDVPVGESDGSVSYDQAQAIIVEEFASFSEDMARFARHAFAHAWIEAEDRPGKRQGGFCTDFPKHRETRIFMTYGDTPGSVQTLAHELGHAYHSWVLRERPGRQRDYPATLAETASTFAESIVREAAMRQAQSDQVRLGMLDRKLSDAVAFVMNIPARFRFERSFWAARQEGELSPDQLSDLMVEALEHAYAGALGAYDKLFWASKLHFYLTHTAFYNFPYAVGFLFSLGLFARAREEGKSFAPRYAETLRLTGGHTVEAVAKQALGVDLSRPDFWQSAVDLIGLDVDAFVALAERA
jgi:oligoendopeptidase F